MTQDNAGIPLGGHLPGDAILRAAGVLLIDPTGNGLFLRRTYDGDHPTEWSLPGGKVEPNESPAEAVVRELEEETGITGVDPMALKLLDRDVKDGVDYTTFYYEVKEAHSPRLNNEHNGFAWTPIEAPPEPTHPGLKSTVKKRIAGQDQISNRAELKDEIQYPPPPNEDGERNVDYMYKRGGADEEFDLETNIAPKAAELNTTTMDYLKFAADKNPRSIESFVLSHGRAFDKKSDDNATESIR